MGNTLPERLSDNPSDKTQIVSICSTHLLLRGLTLTATFTDAMALYLFKITINSRKRHGKILNYRKQRSRLEPNAFPAEVRLMTSAVCGSHNHVPLFIYTWLSGICLATHELMLYYIFLVRYTFRYSLLLVHLLC